MKKKKKSFFSDWHIKLLSLFISISLWYYVISTTMGEKTIKVKLQYKNIPKSVEIKEYKRKYVSVRLQGPISELQKLSGKNIKAYVDLSSAKSGISKLFPIEYSFNLPDRVRLAEEVPKSVLVSFYPEITKKIKIIPKIKGKVAKDYILAGIHLKPRFATIKGTPNNIKDIKKIYTEKISIEGKKKSFTITVALDEQSLKNKYVKIVSPINKQVSVSIDIISSIVTVDIFVPIKVEHLKPSLYVKKLVPKKIRVKIRKKIGIKVGKDDIIARISGDIYSRPEKDKAVVEISTKNKNIELLTKVAHAYIEIEKKKGR